MCIGLVLIGQFCMAYCSDLCKKNTYQDVVYHFCGTLGLISCNILIVVYVCGTCITMLVVLGDQMDQSEYMGGEWVN